MTFESWSKAIRASVLLGLVVWGSSHHAEASDSDLAEKRPLQHEDYAKWNRMGSRALSADGAWMNYVSQPGKGQATLTVREVAGDKQFTIQRAGMARFSTDSQYLVYTVEPDEELVKRLKEEKKPESELPKDQIYLLHLASGKHQLLGAGSRFQMPAKHGPWVAFELSEAPAKAEVAEGKTAWNETLNITPQGIVRPEKPLKFRTEEKQPEPPPGEQAATEESEASAEESESKSKDGKKKEKATGKTLVLRNLESGLEWRFPFAVNSRFSEHAEFFAFATSAEEAEQDGVYVFDLDDLELNQIVSGRGNYGQVVFSKDGRQLAFLSDRDDYSAEEPAWSLYHWRRGARKAEKIADHASAGIPNGWWLSKQAAPQFSEDGKRLYFNTRPRPEEVSSEASKKKDPVAKLDLWHWQDPFLQPEQLLRAEAEKNRSYVAVYHLLGRKVVQLETKEVPELSTFSYTEYEKVLIGTVSQAYDKMRSWDTQAFGDWYVIDVRTGERRQIAEKKRGRPSLSPAGGYVVWWDGEERTWYAQSTKPPKAEAEANAQVDLGKMLPHPLHDELHDQPSLPNPYGLAGWLEDDEALLIRDRFDLWRVDPSGKEMPVCITEGYGRENQIRFDLLTLDSEEKYVDLDAPQYLSAFSEETKATGFFRWNPAPADGEGGDEQPQRLEQMIMLDESVGGLTKAREADVVLFTRSTFERYPDLWSSTLEFKSTRRMSELNPQQAEYRWGTAELVHWEATDGQPLDGLLYKPEGFDPAKQYPLLVYFYERNSDNLHTYYEPAAGRSIINFSFYVSRGYVLFVPDIPYKVGEPGPSAANSVLPGVQSLIDAGFIDAERIGMQGHSWGGYQTAYLVTITDMFACAESGAPVSNMTSAYGGIRWGSGMSRMFQYEKTQSRIGATLWDAPEKYIANSPLFAADKIHTPLLILHNDEDTAVPWYQGIELFVALRRLGRPAWMLNYNGEPHWVMTDENRMDFAQRMQQFFDHYLQGAPMPVWMAEGIPAVDKGKEFGLEYVRPESETKSEESTEGKAEVSE